MITREDMDEYRSLPVTDHQYFGNVCSGFGGRLECKAWDHAINEPCRRSPYDHQYYESKHAPARTFVNITRTPDDYVGKHRLDKQMDSVVD